MQVLVVEAARHLRIPRRRRSAYSNSISDHERVTTLATPAQEIVMQLLIRPKGFRLTSSLREFVVLRLRYALDRFQGVVDSVIVRLRDENGPRGGVDKACQFEVRVRGRAHV